MTEKQPLVTVMIVVYNGETYLGEAIESVLAQTYSPIELIVVDDGSTDTSGDVAKSYRAGLTYEYQDRAGISAARNRAVELATGEYFSFLDADDRMVPHAIGRQANLLQTRRDLEAVFGHVREFLSPDLDEPLRQRLRPPQQLIAGRLPTNMLIRRDAFFRVGPFNTELRRGTGLDWSARAMEKGLASELIPDVLFERRLHSSNHGLREKASAVDFVRAVKASLDRRRASGSTSADGASPVQPAGDESPR